MIANVPRTQARIMISLRSTLEFVDVAVVEVDEIVLILAVDETSSLRWIVSGVEEADRIEEIAIVFVIIDVTVGVTDDPSCLKFEYFSVFEVLEYCEDEASDVEKSFIATSD